MTTTQTTRIAEHILEATNPWKWSKERLSPARQRAFTDQLYKLEQTKWSQESRQAQSKLEEIVDNYRKSQHDRVAKIEQELADKNQAITNQIRALQDQIRELEAQRQQTYEDERAAMGEIYREAYQTEEHKAQAAISEDLHARDIAAYTPKQQELMQRFYDRQVAANAND